MTRCVYCMSVLSNPVPSPDTSQSREELLLENMRALTSELVKKGKDVFQMLERNSVSSLCIVSYLLLPEFDLLAEFIVRRVMLVVRHLGGAAQANRFYCRDNRESTRRHPREGPGPGKLGGSCLLGRIAPSSIEVDAPGKLLPLGVSFVDPAVLEGLHVYAVPAWGMKEPSSS